MDALTTPSNWQRVRLGDILTLKHGRDYKKFKLGNIPVYGSGGYMLSINNFLHNGESVCIGRKGTIDKPIYLNGKFWVVDTLFYSYSFKKSIPKFIFYAFSIIKWSNYNEATGVPSLTKMTISNIEIPLPPLNEQIAIANILSDVDRYLYSLDALILKKESVKKALSFELLSQRKRLKGFNQNWQRVRLGDICEITTGSLDANEMVHYGKYRFYTCAKKYYFIDKYAFDTEAILISGNGAYVGYVHYYKGKFNAYQRTYVLDNFSEHIIFVKYFLTMFLQSHIQTNKNEGNTPYIVMATLKDFEIPLPPLNEQIAIANILSDVDRYLYSLDALILKKESVKKALSFELLSQRKRLKGFNQNWQRVRLGDICEITTGSLDANEMVHYGKYRFYTCAKKYYFIDKYAFDTEAILISGNGAYVGYVHYYKGKFNAYQRTYVLDNFSEHIIFVKYFLTMFLQSHIQTNKNEGNTPYIVMATLKDFEIPLPPLNEQIAIANILSDLDNEIISLKNKKRQFDNIKKALNHDLMSAKIRVLKK
ncbi:restriction endonuclease subunit S [Helicobacter pylori]|nr:restriction endonuclease subunit S [Helicobacter pylori]